VRRVVRVRAIM